MIREEAIYRLKNTAWLGTDADLEATEEAVGMAIEALKAKTDGDLISRQAVKAKAHTFFGHSVIFEGQIDALPSAEAVQGWIPCSERLPEEYGEYLVTKRTIGWNCEEYGSNDIAYFDSDGFHKADKVTAWMPLPEPYKGGDLE